MDDSYQDYIEEDLGPDAYESSNLSDEELKKFLEDAYCDECGVVPEALLEIIKQHKLTKLPATDAMKRYIKHDQDVKYYTQYKEEAREEVLKQLLIINHDFDGIKLSKVKSKPINEEKYYEYIKKIAPPEVLDEITIKVIDYTKLEKAILKDKIIINPEEIPEDLIMEKESYRILIERKKQ